MGRPVGELKTIAHSRIGDQKRTYMVRNEGQKGGPRFWAGSVFGFASLLFHLRSLSLGAIHGLEVLKRLITTTENYQPPLLWSDLQHHNVTRETKPLSARIRLSLQFEINMQGYLQTSFSGILGRIQNKLCDVTKCLTAQWVAER